MKGVKLVMLFIAMLTLVGIGAWSVAYATFGASWFGAHAASGMITLLCIPFGCMMSGFAFHSNKTSRVATAVVLACLPWLIAHVTFAHGAITFVATFSPLWLITTVAVFLASLALLYKKC